MRDSDPLLTRSQPAEQLVRIWHKALDLTEQRRGRALFLAFDATYSDHRKGESPANFERRINNGVPTTLFGSSFPADGPDKLRHFFASALLAFYLTRWLADLAGIGVEVLGFLTQPIGGTGYNQGDIHADQCGAAFGQALKKESATDIKKFVEVYEAKKGRTK